MAPTAAWRRPATRRATAMRRSTWCRRRKGCRRSARRPGKRCWAISGQRWSSASSASSARRWTEASGHAAYFDDGRSVGVVEQQAAHAVLPEFAEQPALRAIGAAADDHRQQLAQARIGKNGIWPKNAIDRSIRVQAAESHSGNARSTEFEQPAPAVPAAQPLEATFA